MDQLRQKAATLNTQAQMQQYKMGLLDKLPISTAVNTPNTNPLLSLIQSSTGTADFLKKWNEIFNPTPPAK
jgi:hypothetical protein